ncbi:protein containing Thioesterase superfamily domain protein [gut metagenome]|uniref:Protein containing Thioesterase superfamily domain protein n=1 Tax=gut metagenome TaxID=749906 RepID=J9CGZ8_9ZZZZ
MKKIVNPFQGLKGYNCFGCAPENPYGVKMEFFEDGEEIVSIWQPRSEYQGWLNTLHGGIQSVLLDEICAWVVMRKLQTAGVTSKMETRFLHAVATDGGALTLRARLREMRRNIALIDAELYDGAGQLCTRTTCTYFTYPQEKARQEMFFQDCHLEEEDA